MSKGRLLGSLVQGLILGLLLIFAMVGILNSLGGGRIFRYQGF